jgi:hypothetical protein
MRNEMCASGNRTALRYASLASSEISLKSWVASWSFVESAFGKDGYFKIAQSGYSFFRNKLKWHPVFLKK